MAAQRSKETGGHLLRRPAGVQRVVVISVTRASGGLVTGGKAACVLCAQNSHGCGSRLC